MFYAFYSLTIHAPRANYSGNVHFPKTLPDAPKRPVLRPLCLGVGMYCRCDVSLLGDCGRSCGYFRLGAHVTLSLGCLGSSANIGSLGSVAACKAPYLLPLPRLPLPISRASRPSPARLMALSGCPRPLGVPALWRRGLSPHRLRVRYSRRTSWRVGQARGCGRHVPLPCRVPSE